MKQFFSLWLLVAAATGCAENPRQGGFDPKAADNILRRLAGHMKSTKGAAFRVSLSISAEDAGKPIDVEIQYAAAFERPNKFCLRPLGEFPQWLRPFSVVADGSTLTVTQVRKNRYIERKCPATLGEMFLGSLMLNVMYLAFLDCGELVASLMHQNPYASLLHGAVRKEYLGTERVGDILCDRLRVETRLSKWDLWTTTGDSPLLVKAAPDLSELDEASRRAGKSETNRKLQVVFSQWSEESQRISECLSLARPRGAERVDSLFPPRQSRMLGQQAPDFELQDLSGNRRRLSSHSGKDIVILEFWATWCGPCVKQMPTLVSVVERYKDKGVVLYAVNKQESILDVKKFVQKAGWTASVLLDIDGAVGELYGVRGIPHAVVIDRNGVVRASHLGFVPELREKLTEELDTIVGKNKE